MFGRKNSLECLPPGDYPASFCTEQEDQIKQQVNDLCQGEDRCEVSASNDFLAMEGTQICPHVSKYLEVKYRCVPKETIPDDGDESSNVVTESIGDASIKSSSSSSSTSTEVLSSSSSPASEVQVLLGSKPNNEDEAVVEVGDQSSSPQSSQEVTEPLKSQESTSKDTDVVNETIKKSKIVNKKKESDGKDEKNKSKEEEEKNSSVLDESEAQNRRDDKYWR